ncbi:MAG TPA: aldo/keto reductase [Patescibacteria group bacterium]|nr:aldo/keto reductase [Patescibacteria group bacterium]
MKYRKFGRLDWEPSALGFGAMRLPIVGDDSSNIDEPLAIEMIRYAIDHGVNYVDSAYGYHGGNSERIVGKALKDGYREKVKLATKMPTWLTKSYDDFDRYLNEQLEKLQTDRIDFYLLHGLNKQRWPVLEPLDVTGWAETAIADGRIGHIGFSFHDDLETFKKIVDYYDWTFCQIQYNYMDTEYQAGTEGLRYAAAKGLAFVIMEPIAGGRLAVPPPLDIQSIWEEADVKRTPAEWALQWVWNQPEVSVVLSGMTAMQHVVENVESAGRSGVGTLTEKELELVARVQEKYGELGFIGCTECRYCQPCPEGVVIPEIFSLVNEFYASDRDDAVKARYAEEIPEDARASKCVRCGACEELCPQNLPIRNLLKNATRTFEGRR